MQIRPLRGMDECRRVAALEREIWGYPDGEDVIPPPVLVASLLRGAILLGAFDEHGELGGFVYSSPAVKHGAPTQWSHVLGVVPAWRESGIGAQLKVAQRDAALAAGAALIEWTFDPMQALNAHFNFSKLGTVCSEYVENLYGDSPSPLHRGAPTDRFVVEWRIAEPHVARRIASWGQPVVRDRGIAEAPVVNSARAGAGWIRPGDVELAADARRVLVEIPLGFTEMLAQDVALAGAWRLQTREIFVAYFARGYRAVDFFLSRQAGRGHYLLARP